MSRFSLKRICLFGASGLLGLNWIVRKSKNYDITAYFNQVPIKTSDIEAVQISFNENTNLDFYIDKKNTDIIINCVAFTDVNKCEAIKDKAYFENVIVAQKLNDFAKKNNIKFVQISTDHLFNGGNNYYNEEAALEPLNYYGITKSIADQYIQNSNKDALIIRTNFFGCGHRYRSSFSDWVFDSLAMGERIKMYTDVYYTPIYVGRLIDSIDLLIKNNYNGIFNIVSNERLSKYDFGINLANVFQLDSRLIEECLYQDQNILRPRDMSLTNKKASCVLNTNLGNVRDSLEQMKRDIDKGLRKKLDDALLLK